MPKKILFTLFISAVLLSSLHGMEPPVIKAEAAIVIAAGTGEIIYARDIDRQMYPASLTKLLTAILLADHKNPGDVLVYSAGAKAVVPYKLDLLPGEELYAGDAMKALLLFSANDVAYMIAENVAGGFAAFSGLMNDKIEVWGLTGSHFVNPHGLHNDRHYSTAYDLSVILRKITQYPWIMQSICLEEETIITLLDNKYELKNRNKLVQVNGCIAGKTGWTPEAGRNFAAIYEREGRRLAAVVLKSEYDKNDSVVFKDMETLVDWAFAKQPDQVYAEGAAIQTIPMQYSLLPFTRLLKQIAVPVQVHRAVLEYTADPGLEINPEFTDLSAWKLNREKPIGKLLVKGREIWHEYPLFPAISGLDIFKRELPFYGLALSALVLLTASCLLLKHFLKRKS